MVKVTYFTLKSDIDHFLKYLQIDGGRFTASAIISTANFLQLVPQNRLYMTTIIYCGAAISYL